MRNRIRNYGHWNFHVVVALVFVALTAHSARAAAVIGQPYQLQVSNTPVNDVKQAFRQPDTIPFPPDNLYTPEKFRLGRALFFDPRLSRSGAFSCSSCHSPALAFGDAASRSIGANHTVSAHRSPSIINVAWNDTTMWDGRFESLETQALAVLAAPGVLDTSVVQAAEQLTAISGYRQMFEAAFPGRPIDGTTIGQAIATYERTVVSKPASFDAWIAGDETAISGAAKNGFAVFTGKAHCAVCHSGPNLTDNGFHDIGLTGSDIGRGRLFPTVPTMQFAYKTPGLREIDRRAPYMHDGSLPTLSTVVEYYDSGGLVRTSGVSAIQPLDLTSAEKADLVAFLQTLSSPSRSASPSGLPR